MSSAGRTTSKGGKGVKADKSHKTDGGKSGGEKVHNKENAMKTEELGIKDKVKQLMDLTCRSEDEVCLALHESNNDMNMAINLLYEEMQTGEWETKDKKKKKRQASAGKDKKPEEGTGGSSDWDDSVPPPPPGNNSGGGDVKDWKERGGGRRNNRSGGPGGPPRRWREDGAGRGGDRRGNGRGTTRGGGRGRGGGRIGGRYPPRGSRGGAGRDYNKQPIDTWDNSNSNTWDNNTATTTVTNHTPAGDDWDDFHTDEWSTEEYTGSLVETKVFTPSVQPLPENALNSSSQGLDQSLSGSSQHQDNSYSQSLNQSYNQTVPQQQSPVPPMVGTLTAAQTQYFSQLSQQNSDALGKQYGNTAYQTQPNTYDTKTNVQQVYNSSSPAYPASSQGYSNASQQSYSNAAQPYNSSTAQQGTYGNAATQGAYGNQSAQSYNNAVSQSYGNAQQSYGNAPAANNYGGNFQSGATAYVSGQEVQQQPQRTKTQRARVPPPSKIPASAVEMPGDLNSSITYLDVQFGAMDLIDGSFDSNSGNDAKYGTENRSTTGLDNSRSTPTSGIELDSSGQRSGTDYSASVPASKNGAQSSISSALTQGLTNSDSIPQASSEHLNYSNASSGRNTSQQSTGASASVPQVTTASGVDLSKQSTESHSYNSQTTAYNSYQPKGNSYSSSAYGSTPTTASSYVNPSAASYVNNQTNSYASGVQNPSTVANSYGNSYSSTGIAAQAYQSATSYPTGAQQSYAASAQNASAYGASSGLSNNPNYTSTSNQYNSYNSTTGSAGHKLGKENSYENTTGVAATSTANSGVPASSGATLSLSQPTISSSKTTTALAKNSTGVMSNIPPGVPPVMSTPYIMGQMPYFQQPVYSYEEMQLLQQRLPHMTTPYYDMGYQTPTTVRDPTAAALGGYGAATADARFQAAAGRAGDGTTSPVPAASQQQQQQQGPILAAAAGTPQPYFFTAFNTIPAPPPNYAQFGTMYTQLPAVTNAHGSSANSQYGPKPATYGSAGYGAYEALGQSAAAAQDYAKSGYAVGTAAAVAHQAAQKGQNSTGGASATNDISAMYGKSHAALGKVNSYEKQGFHSGTPPPFTGTLSQSGGLPPSGAGYPSQVYIPTMAMHQHQPMHQMDVRHQSRRADSGNSSGQRAQGSNQAKGGSKQGGYGASYWNQN
ncbi:protein lingerer isoform X1 [Euwallacea fornicatus]|uniref:protein lingerer isoform X1 n=1 Tax=Euwallacea fornicatus TaxID=995702 RepID=UPI00338D55E2